MANGDFDFTAGQILTAAQVDDYLMLQAVQKFATSAARDSALTSRKREGMVTYQDDSNSLTAYSGSAWSTVGPVHGALTAWTPTVTQSGGVTVTVNTSGYQRIGRWVQGWFELTVTGSGTASNAIIIGAIPATAANFVATAATPVGSCHAYDASTGNVAVGILCLGSATTFDMRGAAALATDIRWGVGGLWNTVALASTDTIKGTFAYPANADA